LARQNLLMKRRNAGGQRCDLIYGASLDRGMELGVQHTHLVIQTSGRYPVLLQGRVNGVLLGRIQGERLGETSFGIRAARSTGAAALSEIAALPEDQSGGSDGEQEEIDFHVLEA
jgi:hypothetical protein